MYVKLFVIKVEEFKHLAPDNCPQEFNSKADAWTCACVLYVLFGVLIISSLPPVDCIDPSCSAHGVCIHGECHCQPGWGGASCEITKAMCPDQCSGHGTYNAETSTCACDQNWTGADCSLGVCTVYLSMSAFHFLISQNETFCWSMCKTRILYRCVMRGFRSEVTGIKNPNQLQIRSYLRRQC